LQASRAAEIAGISYEIIAIDDGSTDGTWEVLNENLGKQSFIKLMRNEKNLGLGASYKKGLASADGEFITWVPGDLSHMSDSLIEAYLKIGHADIIIPRPINCEVRALTRRIISFLYTTIINTLTGLRIPYYNGLSIHKTSLLKQITIGTNGFGFQAEIITQLILKNNATYLVVDTYIQERSTGGSKAFTRKNFIEVAKILFKTATLRFQNK
jgi:glycosyltransferase involved in cell wall biosynthesis